MGKIFTSLLAYLNSHLMYGEMTNCRTYFKLTSFISVNTLVSVPPLLIVEKIYDKENFGKATVPFLEHLLSTKIRTHCQTDGISQYFQICLSNVCVRNGPVSTLHEIRYSVSGNMFL